MQFKLLQTGPAPCSCTGTAKQTGNVSHIQKTDLSQVLLARAADSMVFVSQSKEIPQDRKLNITKTQTLSQTRKSRTNLHSQGWKVLEDFQYEPESEIWLLNPQTKFYFIGGLKKGQRSTPNCIIAKHKCVRVTELRLFAVTGLPCLLLTNRVYHHLLLRNYSFGR